LAENLLDFKNQFNAKSNENVVRAFANGIVELSLSGIAKKALNVGDKVQNFTLSNATNRKVVFSEVLKNGPVVITWYRGGWCPYCNIQLRYLQSFLNEFKSAGASLIAMTPEQPDKSMNTIDNNKLDFEVLTDFDNQVAKQFGLKFKLNTELSTLYEKFHSLKKFNGVDGDELPVPATYVIDTNSIIRYAFIEPDYRKRAEPTDILKAILNIKDLQSAKF
jgi:peroxiredoxin